MYTPRLKTKYSDEIVARLQEKYSYKSVMQVPKLVKICLNQGLGDAVTDKKMVEQACDEMTLITGQKAVATKSKKDISNFKLRKGMPIGARVTLRGDKMYEFLDRFITSSLPRVRDFRGINPKGFDGRGNYNFGVKEQIIFTEINYDKIQAVRGLNITIATSSKTDNEAYELLKSFGFPLKEKPIKNNVGFPELHAIPGRRPASRGPRPPWPSPRPCGVTPT